MSSLSVTTGNTVTTTTNISGTDDVNVQAGGTINVGSGGLDLDWNTDATGPGVTIENAGVIEETGTGASSRAAISTGGANPAGTITINNSGTISSAGAAPAMNFGAVTAGSENITDSGIISGGNGVAIQFGNGTNSLTLVSGYSITGRVIGGTGSNTLNLTGAGGGTILGATEFNGPGGAVSFAGFDNFGTLNVNQGTWSIYGGGYYNNLNIAAGAAFNVYDHPDGVSEPGNPSDGGIGNNGGILYIHNDGVLRLFNSSTVEMWYSPAGHTASFSGAGSLEVGGFFALDPTYTYTIPGGSTVLSGGKLVVFSTVNSNVTVNVGAQMSIGYGGQSIFNGATNLSYVDTGTDGTINGTITDNGTLNAERLDSYSLGGALYGNGVLDKLYGGTLTLQSNSNFSGQVLVDGGTINLAGQIITTAVHATAVSTSGLSSGPVTIVNAGLVMSASGQAIDMSGAAGSVTLTNSGTINYGGGQYAVVFNNLNDTLTNTGTINGPILLGNGNDTLDSHLGSIGTVYLGTGTDTVTLGAENNTVTLAAGTHVVDGGGGTNTASYANAASGVIVSLILQGQAQSTGVGTDTLSNFQNLTGSAFNDTLEGNGGNNVLDGGGGTNTVSYAHAGSGVTVSLELQGQAQNTVGAGIDTLFNFQNLIGSAFNDTLHGGAGPNVLDGGGGLNTAAYDGVLLQYTVGAGGATVAGGPEGGTDTLVNIQRLQFVDGYMAFSTTDTAAQVYRLYEATLNRAPDAGGLAYWARSLDAGMSLLSAAGGFVSSAEFQGTYGALSDTAFVTLLYNNVLHRAPDAGGLSFWTNELAHGYSRAQIVIGFTESNEDIADLAAPVQQGLWVQDGAAAEIARLYDTAFSRLPDITGLAYWTSALEHGTTLTQAAQGFIGSAEFQATYGALDNSGFVSQLYSNVLHRAPDAGGLAYWVSLLATGQDTRAQVVVGFSESPEHVGNTAPHIDSGIWVA
jgi:hypothetical protein